MTVAEPATQHDEVDVVVFTNIGPFRMCESNKTVKFGVGFVRVVTISTVTQFVKVKLSRSQVLKDVRDVH